jgi:hypothetical protein
MKKFVCLVVTFGIMLSAVGAMPSTAETPTFNDIDYVLLLLQIAVSGEDFDEEQLSNFDLNGDGTVNSVDALIAAKEALGISEWTPKPKAPATLSAELENQIKQDYLDNRRAEDLQFDERHPDATSDNVYIREYNGAYNGCVAIMISCYEYHALMPSEDIVAGVRIMYADSDYIKVWNDGIFYRLKPAYDQGLLTRDDIKNIVYHHHKR